MKIISICFFVGSLLVFSSCSNGDKTNSNTPTDKALYSSQVDEINALRDSMSTNLMSKDIKRLSAKLARKTIDFVNQYSDDEKAPGYLLLAAQLQNGLGEYTKSINTLNRLIKRYPEFDHLPEAYFLVGFTYDENMGNKAQAKRVYSEVIEKFPESPFAEQAHFLLENLYLTDDQLYEKLKNSNP